MSSSTDDAENDDDVDQEPDDVEREKLLTDIEVVPIDDVTPFVNNPKEHPDVQIEKIASSIEEFSWDQPIVTDSEGEIIKGHGRFAAAKRLGFEKVPILRNEYANDAEKRAARIADNRVAESGWDDELLQSELERIDESDEVDIDAAGFDDDELDELLDAGEPDIELPSGEKDVDAPEEKSGHIVATLMVDIEDWDELKPTLIDLQEQYDFELDVA